MLSGWNCTPWTGKLACETPITSRSSVSAVSASSSVDAAKYSVPAVADFRKLAVDRDRRAHDFCTERLADRLMAEAYAKDRHALRGPLDQIEANSRFVRRAGTGREHDRVRIGREHVGARELVIAVHGDFRPKLAQVVDEVEAEAIVIVDQHDHGRPRVPGS